MFMDFLPDHAKAGILPDKIQKRFVFHYTLVYFLRAFMLINHLTLYLFQ